MKKPTLLALTGLAALLICGLSTGCKTTGSTGGGSVITLNTNTGLVTIGSWTVNTNQVYTGIEFAAKFGTQQAVKSDTNSVVYFELVESALTVALNDGQLDPILLRNQIADIDTGHVVSPDANAGIVAGLALYQIFWGQVVSQHIANASPYLVPALAAMRDGISAGLPVTSTPAP